MRLLALALAGCASGVGASPDAVFSMIDASAPPHPDAAVPPPDAAAPNVDAPAVPIDAATIVDATRDPLIDDLEDGDGWIRMTDGRAGAWFTYNDGTAAGVQMPSPTADFVPAMGGAGGSRFCAHTSGHGFTSWGAGMGFDLATPAVADGGVLMRGQFNASAYSGIAFAAKGSVPIRVMVVTAAVEPPSSGGTCTDGALCEDAHGADVTLGATWTQVTIPFSQLAQSGWGRAFAFDARTLLGIQFQVAENLTFDVSIDDVRFY